MRSTEIVDLKMSQHFTLNRSGSDALPSVRRPHVGRGQADPLVRHSGRTGLPALQVRSRVRLHHPQAVEVQGVLVSIQRNERHDIRQPQTSHPRLLMAIAIFVNGVKGHSALQLSRDLNVQYKTAFVLSHKLREAVAAESNNRMASSDVEIDGAYFGRYVKPANRKEDRIDRRLLEHQTGKRRVVVIMRERAGRTLPFVFRSEDQSLPILTTRIAAGSTVYADEAAHWDVLHARYLTKRVHHSVAYSENGVSTNQAESDRKSVV